MRYDILRYEDKLLLIKQANKIIRNGGIMLGGARPMREKNKTVFYQTVLINESSKVELGESAGEYI